MHVRNGSEQKLKTSFVKLFLTWIFMPPIDVRTQVTVDSEKSQEATIFVAILRNRQLESCRFRNSVGHVVSHRWLH